MDRNGPGGFGGVAQTPKIRGRETSVAARSKSDDGKRDPASAIYVYAGIQVLYGRNFAFDLFDRFRKAVNDLQMDYRRQRYSTREPSRSETQENWRRSPTGPAPEMPSRFEPERTHTRPASAPLLQPKTQNAKRHDLVYRINRAEHGSTFKASGVVIVALDDTAELRNQETELNQCSPSLRWFNSLRVRMLLGLENRNRRVHRNDTVPAEDSLFWLHFQGKREPEDGDEPQQTALRELFEETAGVLAPYASEIRRQLWSTALPKLWDASSNYMLFVVVLPFADGGLEREFSRRVCTGLYRDVYQKAISWLDVADLNPAHDGKTCDAGGARPAPLYPYFWRCLRSRTMRSVLESCVATARAFEHSSRQPTTRTIVGRGLIGETDEQPIKQPGRTRARAFYSCGSV